MNKLYKDILELKTWVRTTGAVAEGKGQYGKIHSEKQLMDIIYAFNKDKDKSINVIWFNTGAEVVHNDHIKTTEKFGVETKIFRSVILASARVIITNGEESITVDTQGVGEEKTADIAFGYGKSLTYGKRFWLQKFLDLSSDDIDPEITGAKSTSNKPASQKTVSSTELAHNKKGQPIKTTDGYHMTTLEMKKALASEKMPWTITQAELNKL